MSDYIFSSVRRPQGVLKSGLTSIYMRTPPACFEWHGDWGSLAVTRSQYHGFLPYENDRHILVVLGGPVLYFRDNDFLMQPDSSAACQSLYERWMEDAAIDWTKDISGPFNIILVDKERSTVTVVTDLLSFIPTYFQVQKADIVLGTHPDVVALIADERDKLDDTSIADFLLNGIVTFPHTIYENVRQEPPGSVIEYSPGRNKKLVTYWMPRESFEFSDIHEASRALRAGITKYTSAITEHISHMAEFLSGGEDSRSIAGLLPKDKARTAYIFLDGFNREGKVAARVAHAYGCRLEVGYREPLHYLEIMPEATTLVGQGYQYMHAHSLGFHEHFQLENYPAVFGGYLADSLLKGLYAPKVGGGKGFASLYERPLNELGYVVPVNPMERFIEPSVLFRLHERQVAHFEFVSGLRPRSAREWFCLYPASMRVAIPNFYSSRRLFKSYEIFLCHEVVKVASQVPVEWKLNRRLFRRAMAPFLKGSRWIAHGDGRLPYFPWWVNVPFLTWGKVRTRLCRLVRRPRNEGPWADWEALINSSEWRQLFESLQCDLRLRNILITPHDPASLLHAAETTTMQKLNLIQLLWWLRHGKLSANTP